MTKRPDYAIIIPEGGRLTYYFEQGWIDTMAMNIEYFEMLGDMMDEFNEWMAYEADLVDNSPWD